jgi:hypothetical protein
VSTVVQGMPVGVSVLRGLLLTVVVCAGECRHGVPCLLPSLLCRNTALNRDKNPDGSIRGFELIERLTGFDLFEGSQISYSLLVSEEEIARIH